MSSKWLALSILAAYVPLGVMVVRSKSPVAVSTLAAIWLGAVVVMIGCLYMMSKELQKDGDALDDVFADGDELFWMHLAFMGVSLVALVVVERLGGAGWLKSTGKAGLLTAGAFAVWVACLQIVATLAVSSK